MFRETAILHQAFTSNEIITQLYIDDFSIDIFGHIHPDRFIVRLFQKSNIEERNKPLFDAMQLGHISEPQEKNIPIKVIGFTGKVYELIDRLELLGFTLERAKTDFESGKLKTLQHIIQYPEPSPLPLNYRNPSYPDQEAFKNKEHKHNYISQVTFEELLSSCREIIENKLRRVIDFEERYSRSIIPKNVSNLLTRHLICHGFGILYFENQLLLIRTLLESAKADAEVFYEFGEDKNIELIKDYYDSLYDPKEISTRYGLKTLIATEGITDAEYIKLSIEKLYPYLSDLFYFLDFGMKDGGGERLKHLVSTLAASGIPNNIIAIFDNDKAGHEFRNSCQENLPTNFRLLTYPDIELGESYPVYNRVGQTVNENINGKGCAIELYLGRGLLIENNAFLPLYIKDGQLKFNAKIKRKIRAEFDRKLEFPVKREEWIEMDLILQSIFNAFK